MSLFDKGVKNPFLATQRAGPVYFHAFYGLPAMDSSLTITEQAFVLSPNWELFFLSLNMARKGFLQEKAMWLTFKPSNHKALPLLTPNLFNQSYEPFSIQWPK